MRIKISKVEAGDLDGLTYAVGAETAYGERYFLDHDFGTLEAAERLAEKVRQAGDIDPALWRVSTPVYGSKAWQDEAAEAYMYAHGLRTGAIHESDVPESIMILI